MIQPGLPTALTCESLATALVLTSVKRLLIVCPVCDLSDG